MGNFFYVCAIGCCSVVTLRVLVFAAGFSHLWWSGWWG